MMSEDQDPDFADDAENLYQQEFELLKDMFEDHFSSEVIAGVLEDCYGDVNLAVDTLTKIDTPDAVEDTPPHTPTVESNIATECNIDNMASTSNLNPHAMSYTEAFRATASTAMSNSVPSQARHPPRSRNIMPKVDYWTAGMRNIISNFADGNRVLVIMRGAPGCGKTYLAKVIVDMTVGGSSSNNYQKHILSSDDLMVVNGKYQYDATRNSEVHMKNQKRVYRALNEGLSPIIVDNTNMQAWEMYPYVRDGVQNGYIIEVVEPSNPWSRIPSQLAKRNIHGVPKEKIQIMLNRYEGNFSGESILQNFKLMYPVGMTPPIKRNKPPYLKPISPVGVLENENVPNITSNTTNTKNVAVSSSPPVNEKLNSNETSLKTMAKGDTSNPPVNKKYSNNATEFKNVMKVEGSSPQVTDRSANKGKFLKNDEKKLDKLLKVETEWENGDNWEQTQINTKPKTNADSSFEPKPQRSKDIELLKSNQYIEPSMLSDVWIDNLPYTSLNNNNIASPMTGSPQNQDQSEKTINVDKHENKDIPILAVSGYVIEKSHTNDNLINTSDKEVNKTSTVNGRCVHEEKHFIQLRKMFKNVPRAVLREIFDNCSGDVDWACSIVLDGIQHNNLGEVGDEQSDSDEDEEVDFQCQCDKPRDIKIPDTFSENQSPASENQSPNEIPMIRKKAKKDKNLSEDTIQVKKQIENTVKISEHYYSQHFLNLRGRLDSQSPIFVASTSNSQVSSESSFSPLHRSSETPKNNSAASALPANVSDAVPSTSGTRKYEYTLNDDDDDDDGSDDEMGRNVTVNIGMDFVRKLDELYNRHDFEYPEDVKPVLNIPMKILGELNALWIEAISHQMDKVNTQSEQMIKQDEEFARKLELELQLEAEESPSSHEEENAVALEPQPSREPNFKEIMDTELALAIYEKEVKEEWKNKEPQDMAAQMTRKKLYELFPDVGQETLSEMLIAHGNSFDRTVEVLLESTGQGHYLGQQNGINKFVVEKEKENRNRVLLAARNAALSEEEYPYLLKPGGEKQTELSLESVQEWRDKAEMYKNSRDTFFNKAKWYYEHKKLHEANFYSQLAAFNTAKYETASNFAAAALVQYHANTHPGTNIIDLHFLRVPEAETSLDLFIDERLRKMRLAQNPRMLVLHIITGRGKHSPGRPRVKPAVIRRLKYRGLHFRQQNPGLLEARLKLTHKLLEELLNS